MSAVVVSLTSDTERRLRQKAFDAGLTLESYLRELAEKDAGNGASERPVSFEQLAAPVRQAFAESGMTDDELANFVEEARTEVWDAKRAKDAP